MFSGAYPHVIDAKGRLIMPAKLRDGVGKVFYISKGTEENEKLGTLTFLQIFTEEAWKQEIVINTANLSVEETRKYYRDVCSQTVDVTMNEQGRFVIPPILRESAGIEKDAMILGAFTCIEVWDTKTWEARKNS